jgi:hypothetical protein
MLLYLFWAFFYRSPVYCPNLASPQRHPKSQRLRNIRWVTSWRQNKSKRKEKSWTWTKRTFASIDTLAFTYAFAERKRSSKAQCLSWDLEESGIKREHLSKKKRNQERTKWPLNPTTRLLHAAHAQPERQGRATCKAWSTVAVVVLVYNAGLQILIVARQTNTASCM